ncbi:DUF4350 domain-containing protein [Cellulomonas triticagri]|uniref:DUF4350 domain-containing protein n=1 Tax=Cellulomonas triticagri TaxID=2483352 RepID=A0A3M2IXE7_9CELL|nr:DUF4350 domain-containing protein [Cellulomonas triticagri]
MSPVADGTVLGDGTTAAGRARGRWRRWRWVVGIAGVLAIGVGISLLPAPTRSVVPLAPDNAGADGAMAVANVLREQGVEITYVRGAAQARAAATAGTTLLVTSDWWLTPEQSATVTGTAADLVLLDPYTLLTDAVPGLETGWSGGASATSLPAACTDPDAEAAGSITGSGSGVVARDATGAATDAPDGTTLCFPLPGTEPQAYLTSTSEVDGRRVTVLGDAGLLTNARVAEDGNAALVLRTLGRNPHLVWYVPSSTDTSVEAAAPGLGDLLPPTARVLLWQALVVLLAVVVWRGRRLGRVVVERLPVVVRSAETTRGRGRLYRTSRSYGHAAAALRAGVADRCARLLGLPRTAAAPDVITAVARAAHRDEREVADLLYGPPPTSDAGLETLARRLDQLESEVHPT